MTTPLVKRADEILCGEWIEHDGRYMKVTCVTGFYDHGWYRSFELERQFTARYHVTNQVKVKHEPSKHGVNKTG